MAIAAPLISTTGFSGVANRAGGQPDVLVIGAGLSGLNAANLLESQGYRVQVVEGTDRIGGRIYTARDSEVPGHPEIGGSGIGNSYARILDTASRLGLELVPERLRTTAAREDMMYHVFGEGILADDWPGHALNPFQNEKDRAIPPNIYQFIKYAQYNPLPKNDLQAWQRPEFARYDVSVFDFLKSVGVPEDAISLAAGTNMSYGTNAHDLSVLMWFAIANWLRTDQESGTSAPRAISGGNQRLPEAMAAQLKSEVLLGRHIMGIRSREDGVELHTTDDQVLRARYCLCTVPFSALRHIRLDPLILGEQQNAIENIGYTPVFQAHFVPTRKFWQDDELPPSIWTDRKLGRFMALRNDPRNPEEITSYVAFVNGMAAEYLDRLAPDAAAEFLLADLARIRPATKGALKTVKVWSWNRNPFAGGAYAYWKPEQIGRFADQMFISGKRLFFAGEHTAVLARGMEGAMESGERAAIEMMSTM
jgi:monoamine oxidase